MRVHFDASVLAFLIGPVLLALMGIAFRQKVKWLFVVALCVMGVLLISLVAIHGLAFLSGTPDGTRRMPWLGLVQTDSIILLQFVLLISVYRRCVRGDQPRASSP